MKMGQRGIIFPHGKFLKELKRWLITPGSDPEDIDGWAEPLAVALGQTRNAIVKELRRCKVRGGIYLRMAEKWCDAIRVHPTLLLDDYHEMVEIELAQLEVDRYVLALKRMRRRADDAPNRRAKARAAWPETRVAWAESRRKRMASKSVP